MIDINSSTPPRFTWTQIFLHWLSVLLMLSVFTLIVGRGLTDQKILRAFTLSWHEIAGLSILIISLFRLLVFLKSQNSETTRSFIVRAGHASLYMLLIAQPILGLLLTNARGGKALNLYGLHIPQIISANEDLADQLEVIHGWVGWIFLTIILGHIVAALWHIFVKKDQSVGDMLPWIKR